MAKVFQKEKKIFLVGKMYQNLRSLLKTIQTDMFYRIQSVSLSKQNFHQNNAMECYLKIAEAVG